MEEEEEVQQKEEEEEEEAGNGVIIAHEKARITGAQLPVATAFCGINTTPLYDLISSSLSTL